MLSPTYQFYQPIHEPQRQDIVTRPSTASKLRSSKKSAKYEIVFPPGAMGLELEPVIISKERQVGCRVKGVHIGSQHCGIDPSILQTCVGISDIVSRINGESVISLPFGQILETLRGLKDVSRSIVFKNISASRGMSTNQEDYDGPGNDDVLTAASSIGGEKLTPNKTKKRKSKKDTSPEASKTIAPVLDTHTFSAVSQKLISPPFSAVTKSNAENVIIDENTARIASSTSADIQIKTSSKSSKPVLSVAYDSSSSSQQQRGFGGPGSLSPLRSPTRSPRKSAVKQQRRQLSSNSIEEAMSPSPRPSRASSMLIHDDHNDSSSSNNNSKINNNSLHLLSSVAPQHKVQHQQQQKPQQQQQQPREELHQHRMFTFDSVSDGRRQQQEEQQQQQQLISKVANGVHLLGAAASDAVRTAGTALEQQAEQMLRNTSKNIPIYTSEDMNEVVNKKNSILTELSLSCVLLGQAEERERQFIAQSEKNSNLTQRVKDLEHQNSESVQEIERVTVLLKKAEAEIALANSDLSVEHNQLLSLKKDNVELLSENRVSAEKLASIAQELAAANAVIELLQTEVETEKRARTSELHAWKEEIHSMAADQAALQTELHEAFSQAQNRLESAEQERDSFSAEVDVLKDLLKSDHIKAEQEQHRLKHLLQEAKAAHVHSAEESTARLNELAQLLDEARVESTEAADLARSTVEKNKQLSIELASLKAHSVEAEQQHREVHEASRAVETSLQQMLTEAQTKCEAALLGGEDVALQLSVAMQAKDALAAELEVSTALVKSLQADLTQSQEERAQAEEHWSAVLETKQSESASRVTALQEEWSLVQEKHIVRIELLQSELDAALLVNKQQEGQSETALHALKQELEELKVEAGRKAATHEQSVAELSTSAETAAAESARILKEKEELILAAALMHEQALVALQEEKDQQAQQLAQRVSQLECRLAEQTEELVQLAQAHKEAAELARVREGELAQSLRLQSENDTEVFAELTAKVGDLESSLAAKVDECNELSSFVDMSNLAREELNESHTTQVATLEATLLSLSEQLQESGEELQQALSKYAQVTQQNTALRAETEKTETLNAELKDTCDKLEITLNTMSSTVQTLRKQNAEWEEKYVSRDSANQEKLSRLEQQLCVADSNLQDLQAQLSSREAQLQEACQGFLSELCAVRSELKSTREEVVEAESVYINVVSAITAREKAGLESLQEKHAKANLALLQQLASSEKIGAGHALKLADSQQRCTELQKQLEALGVQARADLEEATKKQKSEIKMLTANFDVQFTELRKAQNASNEALHQAVSHRTAAQDRVCSVEKEVSVLTEKLKMAETENEELTSRMNELRCELTAQHTDGAARFEQVVVELQEAQQLKKQVEAQLSAVTAELKSRQSDLELAEKRCAESEEAMSLLRSQHQEAVVLLTTEHESKMTTMTESHTALLQATQETLAKSSLENNTLQEKLSTLQTKLDMAQQEQQQQQQEIVSIQEMDAVLASKLNTVTRSLQQLLLGFEKYSSISSATTATATTTTTTTTISVVPPTITRSGGGNSTSSSSSSAVTVSVTPDISCSSANSSSNNNSSSSRGGRSRSNSLVGASASEAEKSVALSSLETALSKIVAGTAPPPPSMQQHQHHQPPANDTDTTPTATATAVTPVVRDNSRKVAVLGSLKTALQNISSSSTCNSSSSKTAEVSPEMQPTSTPLSSFGGNNKLWEAKSLTQLQLLEAALSTATRHFELVKIHISTREQASQSLTHKLNAALELQASLQRRIEEAQGSENKALSSAHAEISSLHSSLEQAKERHRAAETQCAATKALLEAAQQEAAAAAHAAQQALEDAVSAAAVQRQNELSSQREEMRSESVIALQRMEEEHQSERGSLLQLQCVLQEQLRVAQERSVELEASFASSSQVVEHLQQEKSDMQKKLKSIQAEYDGVIVHRNSLLNKQKALSAQCAELEQELRQVRESEQQLLPLEQVVQELRKEAASVAERHRLCIVDAQTAFDALQESKLAVDAKLLDVGEQARDLKALLAKTTSELESAKEQVKLVEREKAALELSAAATQAAHTGTEALVESLKMQLAEEKNFNRKTIEELQAQLTDRTTLEDSTVSALQKQLEEQNALHAAKMADLKSELTTQLEAEKQCGASTIESLRGQIDDLQEQACSAASRVSSLVAEVHELEDKMSSLDEAAMIHASENEILKLELKSSKTEKTSLEEKLKSVYSEAVQQRRASNAEVNAKLEQATQKLSSLNAANDKMKSQLQEMLSTILMQQKVLEEAEEREKVHSATRIRCEQLAHTVEKYEKKEGVITVAAGGSIRSSSSTSSAASASSPSSSSSSSSSTSSHDLLQVEFDSVSAQLSDAHSQIRQLEQLVSDAEMRQSMSDVRLQSLDIAAKESSATLSSYEQQLSDLRKMLHQFQQQAASSQHAEDATKLSAAARQDVYEMQLRSMEHKYLMESKARVECEGVLRAALRAKEQELESLNECVLSLMQSVVTPAKQQQQKSPDNSSTPPLASSSSSSLSGSTPPPTKLFYNDTITEERTENENSPPGIAADLYGSPVPIPVPASTAAATADIVRGILTERYLSPPKSSNGSPPSSNSSNSNTNSPGTAAAMLEISSGALSHWHDDLLNLSLRMHQRLALSVKAVLADISTTSSAPAPSSSPPAAAANSNPHNPVLLGIRSRQCFVELSKAHQDMHQKISKAPWIAGVGVGGTSPSSSPTTTATADKAGNDADNAGAVGVGIGIGVPSLTAVHEMLASVLLLRQADVNHTSDRTCTIVHGQDGADKENISSCFIAGHIPNIPTEDKITPGGGGVAPPTTTTTTTTRTRTTTSAATSSASAIRSSDEHAMRAVDNEAAGKKERGGGGRGEHSEDDDPLHILLQHQPSLNERPTTAAILLAAAAATGEEENVDVLLPNGSAATGGNATTSSLFTSSLSSSDKAAVTVTTSTMTRRMTRLRGMDEPPPPVRRPSVFAQPLQPAADDMTLQSVNSSRSSSCNSSRSSSVDRAAAARAAAAAEAGVVVPVGAVNSKVKELESYIEKYATLEQIATHEKSSDKEDEDDVDDDKEEEEDEDDDASSTDAVVTVTGGGGGGGGGEGEEEEGEEAQPGVVLESSVGAYLPLDDDTCSHGSLSSDSDSSLGSDYDSFSNNNANDDDDNNNDNSGTINVVLSSSSPNSSRSAVGTCSPYNDNYDDDDAEEEEDMVEDLESLLQGADVSAASPFRLLSYSGDSSAAKLASSSSSSNNTKNGYVGAGAGAGAGPVVVGQTAIPTSLEQKLRQYKRQQQHQHQQGDVSFESTASSELYNVSADNSDDEFESTADLISKNYNFDRCHSPPQQA